jgi:uncharacterized protein (DUF2062 family)
MNWNLRRWLKDHSLKLLAIRDTPNAIAGGVAIGIFFGFTPLLGLKTLLSIFFAWLTRSNIIAAVIAVTLHDVALPFMPVLFRWEYNIGYWLLSDPHQWPERLRDLHWRAREWRNWTTFFSVGQPLLLGSVLVSGPVALLAFCVTRGMVTRHRRKHPHAEPAQPAADSAPRDPQDP